jgi:hypothetical protein
MQIALTAGAIITGVAAFSRKPAQVRYRRSYMF